MNLIYATPVSADTGYVDSAIAKIREIQKTYPVGSKFNASFNGAIQCKGFADYVYYQMFGLQLPPYTSSKNTITHNSNISVVGEITSRPTVDQLKNMFSKGRTGDIIQGRKQSSQHTMVFMYATDSEVISLAALAGVNNVHTAKALEPENGESLKIMLWSEKLEPLAEPIYK